MYKNTQRSSTFTHTVAALVVAGIAVAAGSSAYSGTVALPDLIVDQTRLANSIEFRKERFRNSDCAIVEECVAGTGTRKLLRFDTVVANIGAGDVVLGSPVGNPLFEFSPCHGHYHLSGFSNYELLDADSNIVVRGHKQAFCLLDSSRYLATAGSSHGYTCANQGLTAGWQDVYSRSLDCQWIDVTGVAPGNYTLRVTINPDGVLEESDTTNNTASVPVTISNRKDR